MGQIGRVLFNLYFWTYCIIASVFFYFTNLACWMATFWWDPTRWLCCMVSSLWCHSFLLASPGWDLRIRGREKLLRDQPVLFVSNHLSSFDILVLFCLYLPCHWVSKSSNTKMPLIGWNMYFNRTIFLDRDSPRDILKMMKQAIHRLAEEKISVMIFPEGERSLTGQLRPFLGGAFTVAKKARVPIQAIVLTGTYQILSRDRVLSSPVSTLTLTVLDPIPVEEVERLSGEELSARVWDQMVENLPPEHQPAEEPEHPEAPVQTPQGEPMVSKSLA